MIMSSGRYYNCDDCPLKRERDRINLTLCEYPGTISKAAPIRSIHRYREGSHRVIEDLNFLGGAGPSIVRCHARGESTQPILTLE